MIVNIEIKQSVTYKSHHYKFSHINFFIYISMVLSDKST